MLYIFQKLHSIVRSISKKTSPPGIEPGPRVPETLVLPLHHGDIYFNSLPKFMSFNLLSYELGQTKNSCAPICGSLG